MNEKIFLFHSPEMPNDCPDEDRLIDLRRLCEACGKLIESYAISGDMLFVRTKASVSKDLPSTK